MTVPDTSVRLTVLCEPADYADGLAARRCGRPRRKDWLSLLLLIPALLSLVVTGHWVLVTVVSILLGLTLVSTAVSFFFPHVPYLLMARALVKNNRPAIDGTIIVTDAGLGFSNSDLQSTIGWSRYQRFVETDRSFVLLTSDKLNAGIFVLPKRAVTEPRGVDQLRVLLSRHLPRFVG
jgi:YcxB-like protein